MEFVHALILLTRVGPYGKWLSVWSLLEWGLYEIEH